MAAAPRDCCTKARRLVARLLGRHAGRAAVGGCRPPTPARQKASQRMDAAATLAVRRTCGERPSAAAFVRECARRCSSSRLLLCLSCRPLWPASSPVTHVAIPRCNASEAREMPRARRVSGSAPAAARRAHTWKLNQRLVLRRKRLQRAPKVLVIDSRRRAEDLRPARRCRGCLSAVCRRLRFPSATRRAASKRAA